MTTCGLYALSTTDISTSHNYAAYLSSAACDVDTWHYQTGHMNFKTVVNMSQSGAIKDMPIDLSKMPAKCEFCIMGKQVRNSILKI